MTETVFFFGYDRNCFVSMCECETVTSLSKTNVNFKLKIFNTGGH